MLRGVLEGAGKRMRLPQASVLAAALLIVVAAVCYVKSIGDTWLMYRISLFGEDVVLRRGVYSMCAFGAGGESCHDLQTCNGRPSFDADAEGHRHDTHPQRALTATATATSSSLSAASTHGLYWCGAVMAERAFAVAATDLACASAALQILAALLPQPIAITAALICSALSSVCSALVVIVFGVQTNVHDVVYGDGFAYHIAGAALTLGSAWMLWITRGGAASPSAMPRSVSSAQLSAAAQANTIV